jgi:beta-glucanase (GH16 family)
MTYADVPQGTNVTVTARVQPSSTGNEGLRLCFECLTGSGAASSQAGQVVWHNLKNSTLPFYNPANLAVTVTQPLSGVFEIVVYGPVPGDGTTPNNFTVSLAPCTGGDGNSSSNPFTATSGGQNATITFWGMSCAVGKYGANYGQTGANAVTSSGDVVTLQGALATPLSGSAGTICIELGPCSYAPSGSSNGNVLSANAGGTDVLSVNSWNSISNANGTQTVPVGMGGMAGITRLVFAHDNTGYSMCVNGGLVGQFATLLNLSGTQQLLSTLNGSVRRITGWNYRMTNANAQGTSAITNQTFVNSGGSPTSPALGMALNVNNTTQTFFDDFLNINTIRVWNTGANVTNLSAGPEPNIVTAVTPGVPYTGTGGPGGMYGATGNWIPRIAPYCNTSWITGTSLQGNNEWEWYPDPSYPWASGFISPFSQAGSQLTITIRRVSDMGTNIVNQFAGGSPVPYMPPNAGNGSTSPYAWTSGALISAGVFTQQFGYFEIRAELPAAGTCWPAFWMYNGNKATGNYNTSADEIDIVEAFAIGTDAAHQVNSYSSTMHWNGGEVYDLQEYTPSPPGNRSQSWNTFGCEWRPGYLNFYLNGACQFSLNTQTFATLPPTNGGLIVATAAGPSTTDTIGPFYLLINCALGGANSPPTGAEEGAVFNIDYVGAWQ